MRAATRNGWGIAAMVAGAAVWGMPASAPAGHAQEEREDRRAYRVELGSFDSRPRLGVYLGEVREGEGVMVVGVSPGSPAEEAGIREGDVIVSIGGHALADPLDREEGRRAWSPTRRLRTLVGEAAEGEAVSVGVERDGERLEFDVAPEWLDFPQALDWTQMESANERLREAWDEVRERYESIEWPRYDTIESPGLGRDGTIGVRVIPSAPYVSRWQWQGDFDLAGTSHGLELVELNPGLGAYFGTAEGVLVADADEDSPLGLMPGDVVTDVEGRRVDDVAELRRILRSYAPDEDIRFRIWRDGAETTIVGSVNRP